MTATVLKQDPNIKRFKRTLTYFNTDTQYAHFRIGRCSNLPSTEQAAKTLFGFLWFKLLVIILIVVYRLWRPSVCV